MRMQTTNQILQAIRKLGVQRTPLTRVYRCLFNENLYLTAYGKIYSNQGALTPGTEDDTMDGMSLPRVRKLIELLRHERFQPRPSRRTTVPKKSGGRRPLGIPNGSEKLVQEVLRLVLEAYYEPRFRESSHGFRPERGCHTALKHLKQSFTGTTWFIEGDIKGCFDTIDHDILLNILRRDIQDGRLIALIERFLKAGYMEEWEYHQTYSGTPQGGILSPLLSNIYLHELDRYIEDELIPQHTQGKRRDVNLEYKRLSNRIEKARKRGDLETAHQLELDRRQLPSQDTHDPNYRRLRYCRYADDFILGFIGSKSEAEAIKTKIGAFLRDTLHLEMHEQKTLITHARTQHARFLGYAISVYHSDSKLSQRGETTTYIRSINGAIRLGLPWGLAEERAKVYQRDGKAVSERRLVDSSIPHIIQTYQLRFRGLVQYYQYAVDVHELSRLKYAMEIALVKTLAHKLRITVKQVYRRFHSTLEVADKQYKVLKIEVDTDKGKRRYHWGAIPLTTTKVVQEPVNDSRHDFEYFQFVEMRSEIVTRLCANQCEICGVKEECEVHHARKLSDLKKRWQGRPEKPAWVKKMIALQRKTLVVCRVCHRKIHNGEPLPYKTSV